MALQGKRVTILDLQGIERQVGVLKPSCKDSIIRGQRMIS